MVIPIIAREAVRAGAQYIAKGLRLQDKLIDTAYSRPFLRQNFNRHALKGIKHGLGGGSIVGIYMETDPLTDDQENGFPSSITQTPSSYGRLGKTRGRYSRRSRDRCKYIQSDRRYG